MEATIIRATIMFLAGLTALTVFNVVAERRKGGSTPFWVGFGLVILWLGFIASAAILPSAIFVTALSDSEWLRSLDKDAVHAIIAGIGVLGFWASSILYQLCCNALR